MGIVKLVKGIYNLIMGLVGLAVIGVVVYVFFINKMTEYEEEQYAEERGELIAEFEASLERRGFGDTDALRAAYREQCPIGDYRVIEGDADAICESFADVLLDRSVDRGLSLADFGELEFRLCAHDYVQDGEDPEDYCDREYAIETAKADALAKSLCAFDAANVYDPEYGEYLTKRGDTVYQYFDERVDCSTGLIVDYEQEGFFASHYDEDDEDYPAILERLYELIDEDIDAAIAELDRHEFGEDPQLDRWILSNFLWDDYAEFVAAVLERNGGQVMFEGDYYRQPLTEAISSEAPKVALMLLEAGASPLRPDDDGNPPIVSAASNGMLEVVRELVARGADVNGVKGSDALGFGWPLSWSAYNGHADVVFFLLENGAALRPANPGDYPDWDEDSLIEYAAEGGDLRVFEAFVARGAKTSDTAGLVADAVEGGNANILARVFELGYAMPDAAAHDDLYAGVVDVIEEEYEGKYRIEHGLRMFDLLLQQGLDLSEVSDAGWHRGHQAVRHYVPPTVHPAGGERDAFVREQRLRFVRRVIDEVLEAGIDVDARHEGRTMLMAAADNGQAEIAAYLLAQGADPALTDDDGRTALDIAIAEGRRLNAFWSDDMPEVGQRFGATVEVLGGRAGMIEPEATAASD